MLRPLATSDSAKVCHWMTSSYILHHSFVIPSSKSIPEDFATKDYAARYFDMLISDPKRLTFAIMLNDAHVGTVGLKDINFKEMNAECFIEIGEAQFRGHGFGASAMKLLLDFAFLDYGLNHIALEVLEFNYPALKVYYKLGFVPKGTSGWHYDEFGQYWLVLKMAIMKDQWPANSLF